MSFETGTRGAGYSLSCMAIVVWGAGGGQLVMLVALGYLYVVRVPVRWV